MSVDDGRWYTVAETAQHFRVGKDTVYSNCSARKWPHHRVGTHIRAPIRFSPEDWAAIDELLKVPAVVPPPRYVPSQAQIDRGMKRRMPQRVPSPEQLDRGMRRMLARTSAQTKPPA